MTDDIANQIDKQVSARRTELQAMSLNEIGREFEDMFQMHPNLAAGKDNLIERVLAKVRAELSRRV